MADKKKLKRLGIALIISGPSGSGKTTVCSALRKLEGNLHFSVSCTTRPSRRGEIHGSDYYFISKNEFKEKINNDEFLEYAKVHGHFYGTLKSEVLKQISSGKDVLLDIDVQGATSIKRKCAEIPSLSRSIESVFIAPPSIAELEKRLGSRATETKNAIHLRLKNAKAELKHWKEYDYLVINDKLEKTVAEMRSLLEALGKSTKRMLGENLYD